MFNNRKETFTKTFEISDTALDGLFSGMLAGLVMEAYLTVSGILAGLPVTEALTRLSPVNGLSPTSGLLLHFAISGIYGLLFGFFIHWLLRRHVRQYWSWLAGLGYGIFLLLVAVFFVLPNSDSAIREIPIVHLAVAHLIFGLVLGIRIHKK